MKDITLSGLGVQVIELVPPYADNPAAAPVTREDDGTPTDQLDLRTAEGVRLLMSRSQNDIEWGNNCDKVKAANGGDYPSFWWETCIASGLLAVVKQRW